ncbi:MAG: hypothetical protein M1837_006084 [Sclerophora amabilis]|nr:MAG: hypothetical protein M1837_006084 [Sclerophora amabilis]
MHRSQLLTLIVSLTASTFVSASPIQNDHQLAKRAEIECYRGADFPDESKWLDFTTLFNNVKPALSKHNSGPEIGEIWNAVQSASSSSKIDKRIIFSVILQESGGDVRTRTGDDGQSPGLMQIHGGTDCLSSSYGECPKETIHKMVNNGVQGTGPGGADGLKTCYARYGNSYPKALRCYNSGSVTDPSNLSSVSAGTPSYVSDIGNRLQGADPYADGATKCFGEQER